MSYVLSIERELSPSERSLFRSRYERHVESRTTAIVLGIFFGTLGGHRFYLGQIGWGVGYLLLLGWTFIIPYLNVFVWVCVLFEVLTTVGGRVDDHNREFARGIRNEIVFLREGDAQPSKSPAATLGTSSGVEELERLAALREKGHLTDQEFESQKRKLLDT